MRGYGFSWETIKLLAGKLFRLSEKFLNSEGAYNYPCLKARWLFLSITVQQTWQEFLTRLRFMELQPILKTGSALTGNGTSVPVYGQSIRSHTAHSILPISSNGRNYLPSGSITLSALETDYMLHRNFSDTAMPEKYLMQG